MPAQLPRWRRRLSHAVLAWTSAFALVTIAHFTVGLLVEGHPALGGMLLALCLGGLLAGPMTLVSMVQNGVRDSGWAFRSVLFAWLCLVIGLVGALIGAESTWPMGVLSGLSVVLACNGLIAFVSNCDARKAETRLRERGHVTS